MKEKMFMKENNLSEEYKEELMRNAVYVNNSIELKTAIAKKRACYYFN